MYDKGDGVAVDQAKAFEYYRAAADQHDTNAEFGLGVDYEFGMAWRMIARRIVRGERLGNKC
jgi:TPR repeat protein